MTLSEVAHPSEMEGESMFRRIMVAVDLSESSRRALGAALKLRRTLGGALCLYHIADGETGADEFLASLGSGPQAKPAEEAVQRLARFVDNVAPGQRAGLELIASGDVADPERRIVRETKRWNATLLILGAQAHRYLLRTDRERLISDLEIPVLVIPPQPTS